MYFCTDSWSLFPPQEYQKAFIGLCLPTVFGPFVRRELLRWNMLSESGASIVQMEWFRALHDFADVAPELAAQQFAGTEENSNEKVIPLVLEKVVVPHMQVVLANMWNPLSGRQTRGVGVATRDALALLGAAHPSALRLQELVANRIGSAVDSLAVPPAEVPSSSTHSYWAVLDVLGSRIRVVGKVSHSSG